MSLTEKVKGIFAGDARRVKVPTVLQMEATECGAAALAMILAHYGLWIPLEKLRAECGVNRDGSKASCVIRAARNRNCEADGYRWTVDNLLKLLSQNVFPLIIHCFMEGIDNHGAQGQGHITDSHPQQMLIGIAGQVLFNAQINIVKQIMSWQVGITSVYLHIRLYL